MIKKIGTFKIKSSDTKENIPMPQIDGKQIEEAFANMGKALFDWAQNMTAQGVFGRALTDMDSVPNELAKLDTDLVWKIQEAAADLALVADMELASRGV